MQISEISTKDIYQMQFELRNLMVPFILLCDI